MLWVPSLGQNHRGYQDLQHIPRSTFLSLRHYNDPSIKNKKDSIFRRLGSFLTFFYSNFFSCFTVLSYTLLEKLKHLHFLINLSIIDLGYNMSTITGIPQAGGHQDQLSVDSNQPEKIIKKTSQKELEFYCSLVNQLEHPFTPSDKKVWSEWRPQFFGTLNFNKVGLDDPFLLLMKVLLSQRITANPKSNY
jgi:hypothetical protein